tara:strand:+ start:265 stop:426 length:162 start_codon:yes stop_codon:yes gene_type:complete
MAEAKIVKSDNRGQIVIPKNIRKELNLDNGAAFWMYVDKGKIVLEKVRGPKDV